MSTPAAAKECILSCDIGTTSTKITVIARDGGSVFETSSGYATYYGDGGAAEQNPEDWWGAFCDITGRFVLEKPEYAGAVAAICISGKTLGLIPSDSRGRLTRSRNLIYQDTRAQGCAQQFLRNYGHERFYRQTGAGHTPGMYPLFKMKWLQTTEPDVFSKTAKFLQAKSHIIHRLTGQFVTDPSCASQTGMLDIHRLDWSREILDAAEIDEDRLPEIRPSTAIVGAVTRAASAECGLTAGMPVINGGGDVTCACLGSGVGTGGDYYVNIGSSAWWGQVADAPRLDFQKRILSLAHVIPGKYAPHLTLYNGANCEEWIRKLVYEAPDETMARIDSQFEEILQAAATTDTEGLVFLGHLAGAGAPLYNPDARGVFFGLAGHHRKAHLYRAVLEGIACQIRWCGDALGFSPSDAAPVRLIGGGARNGLWRQIVADTLGTECAVLPNPKSSSSLGAAIIGAVGLGWFSDFDAARSCFIVDEGIKRIVPQPDSRAAARYSQFQNLYFRLYSDATQDITQ